MEGIVTISFSAFVLGVLHALEPGHGKAMMASALISSKRKWLDPVVLAFSTAIGHMVGVLIFTVISFLIAHEIIAPEIKDEIETFIGIFIFIAGLYLLFKHFFMQRKPKDSCRCCAHTSTINIKKSEATRHLSFIGLSVGLVPCPSALALAATAATFGSFAIAISSAFIYGLGVAFMLLLIGIAITCSVTRVQSLPGIDKIIRVSRFIAPISLLILGIVIFVHAGSHSH